MGEPQWDPSRSSLSRVGDPGAKRGAAAPPPEWTLSTLRRPSVRQRTELGMNRKEGGRLQPPDADTIVSVTTSGTTRAKGDFRLAANAR